MKSNNGLCYGDQNGKSQELKKFYGLEQLTISKDKGGGICIDMIMSNHKGAGTRFFDDLVMIADKYNIVLSLTPSNDWMPLSKVRKFYTNYGFKNTTKEDYDKLTWGQEMIRKPRKQ